MPELTLLKAADCIPLRQSVLRPDRPGSENHYPQDDDERSAHYGIRHRKKTLAVASMLHDPRGDVGSEMWRIRGMAVLPDEQRKGYGAMLLKTLQAIVAKRGGGAWANVRTTAADFYGKHGFRQEGDVFDIEGIGPHVLMTWRPEP